RVKLSIANDQRSTENVLIKLADDDDADVRLAVLKNPNTTDKVRDEVYKHPLTDALANEIVKDPHTPSAVLLNIAKTANNDGLRVALLFHTNVTDEIVDVVMGQNMA